VAGADDEDHDDDGDGGAEEFEYFGEVGHGEWYGRTVEKRGSVKPDRSMLNGFAEPACSLK
jgi:hypothetical protein